MGNILYVNITQSRDQFPTVLTTIISFAEC